MVGHGVEPVLFHLGDRAARRTPVGEGRHKPVFRPGLAVNRPLYFDRTVDKAYMHEQATTHIGQIGLISMMPDCKQNHREVACNPVQIQ